MTRNWPAKYLGERSGSNMYADVHFENQDQLRIFSNYLNADDNYQYYYRLAEKCESTNHPDQKVRILYDIKTVIESFWGEEEEKEVTYKAENVADRVFVIYYAEPKERATEEEIQNEKEMYEMLGMEFDEAAEKELLSTETLYPRALVDLDGDMFLESNLAIGYIENLVLNRAILKVLEAYPSAIFQGTVHTEMSGEYDLWFSAKEGKATVRREPHGQRSIPSLIELLSPFREALHLDDQTFEIINNSTIEDAFSENKGVIDQCLQTAGYEFEEFYENNRIRVICSYMQCLDLKDAILYDDLHIDNSLSEEIPH